MSRSRPKFTLAPGHLVERNRNTRLRKRVLVSLMEVCVFLICSILTITLTEWLNSNFIFICGVALTICIPLAIRKKTKDWKIKYAAEAWLERRSKPPLLPSQSRRSRILCRSLLWFPSICAALVLCFCPLASHPLTSGKLIDYRVPIPWTWMIVYRYQNPGLVSSVHTLISSDGVGRFGVTPFWRKDASYSTASFAAYTWSSSPEDKRQTDYLRRQNATDIATSEFTVGELHFACVEYMAVYQRFPNLSGLSVQCEASTTTGKGHFMAYFFGRREDIPAFYDVLHKVKRTE
jgi:hypothetical protein